jgi:D-amino-acid dehydrogenase
MHVVVIGAGVIGVTTAHYLSEQGCRVTVIDRAAEVADGASHANAGQLSYTFTDALAKPEFIARIPGLIAGRDPGSKVRLTPSLVPWGLRFLSQCTSERASANTIAVLKTALRSAELMAELRTSLPIDFSHRASGKLVLLSNAEELHAAEASAQLKNKHGSDAEVLSASEAIHIEPALARLNEKFIAAVYSKGDAVADSRKFTRALKERLEETGNVTFRLGCNVDRLTESGGRLQAVNLEDEEIAADAAVVCSGAWSGQLLRPLGVNPHIYPVRGYSVTLPPGDHSPFVSVTILRRRIVFSRMNCSTRIAGFADFKGFNTADDEKRIAALVDIAKSCAPLAADYSADNQHQWGGFRPMTPNGRPRVGPSDIDGLYLNTGHGMLGWTLACASAYDVAHSITSALH